MRRSWLSVISFKTGNAVALDLGTLEATADVPA